MIRKTNVFYCIVCSFLFPACSLIDPGLSSDKLQAAQVFTNNDLATGAVVRVYEEIASKLNFLVAGASAYAGTYSDELIFHGDSQEKADFCKVNIRPTNSILETYFWITSYNIIESINRCIDGLSQYSLPDTVLRKQLMGECKVLRAAMFFYLSNFYGDVPLTTKSDYQGNEIMPRTPLAVINSAIIADLKASKELLTPQYPRGGSGRVNRWCASTLLARMYLYDNNYTLAAQEATSVISSDKYALQPLDSVFLTNSKEAILQIHPMIQNQHTMDGVMFIPGPEQRPSFSIAAGLLEQFEDGDKRRLKWIGSVTLHDTTYHYPWKYKRNVSRPNEFTLIESVTVFRLAELYLIRAEAYAAQGHVSAAIADIDVIRRRAGLPLFAAIHPNISSAQLINAIHNERRLEFFAELGHRFMDLKRTGKLNEVLQPIKPRWSKAFELWPIPTNQIVLNPKLVQNPGYSW